MSTSSSLLRTFVAAALFSIGCGDSVGSEFPPETDGSTEDTGELLDSGPSPTFDVPTTPIDSGVPPRLDAGNPRDTGNPIPRDTGNPNPPQDTGGGGGGVCPSSCAVAADCNPCRDPSDPPGSTYCCVSGLCLYMSGMCPSGGNTDAGGGGGGGGDGGSDGGGGGGGGSDAGDAGSGGPGADGGG